MNNIKRWFHIKLDRQTQDAKIQTFAGQTHQEIDLQIRAELSKLHRQYDALMEHAADMESQLTTLQRLYSLTLTDAEQMRAELLLINKSPAFAIHNKDCNYLRLTIISSEHMTQENANTNDDPYNQKQITLTISNDTPKETVRKEVYSLMTRIIT